MDPNLPTLHGLSLAQCCCRSPLHNICIFNLNDIVWLPGGRAVWYGSPSNEFVNLFPRLLGDLEYFTCATPLASVASSSLTLVHGATQPNRIGSLVVEREIRTLVIAMLYPCRSGEWNAVRQVLLPRTPVGHPSITHLVRDIRPCCDHNSPAETPAHGVKCPRHLAAVSAAVLARVNQSTFLARCTLEHLFSPKWATSRGRRDATRRVGVEEREPLSLLVVHYENIRCGNEA
ncbi:hypothetical protein CBL_00208 [Carabus blaptoides fortunei]